MDLTAKFPWRQRQLDYLHFREFTERKLTAPISVMHEEAAQFVDYILADLATRKSSSVGGMTGKHVSHQGKIKHLRGSDLVERVYVCVEAYRLAGLTIWRACEKVAESKSHPVFQRLGLEHQPCRGRRRKTKIARGWVDTVENIRTLYYSFKRKRSWSHSAFSFWWSNWQFCREHMESKKFERRNRAVLRW